MQGQRKQYYPIKPTIKFPLVLISAFLKSIFVMFFFGMLFGAFLSPMLMIFFEVEVIQVLIIFLILFVIILIILTFLQKASLERTEYRFYRNKLEYYEGFLVKNRKTINYDRITNIGQRKGIIENIFGLGTIFIDTAGSSRKGHEVSIHYLKNPDKIYEWISSVTSNYRRNS